MTMLGASSENFLESPQKDFGLSFCFVVFRKVKNRFKRRSAGKIAYATGMLAGFAAVGAEAADFCAGYCDFDAAVAGDLGFQLLVEFAFEFAYFAAADAGHVNVVAGSVAFVEMAIAAEMQQVELVYEAVAFEQIKSAIDGDSGYARVELLGALENFVGVQVATGGVHYLQEDAALASEADAAGAEFTFEMAREFVIDAFASGDAMCGCG
jgi:hypothetical protein